MSDFRFFSIVFIFRGCLSLTPLVVLFREGVGPGLFKHKVIILLQKPNSADRLVSLISDMVKFNSAYLNQAVVMRFTVRLAQISCNYNSEKEIFQCLDIYSSVLSCTAHQRPCYLHLLRVQGGQPAQRLQ